MASWKKVIVSGSDAHLNHITSSGNIEVVGNISGSSTSTGSFGSVHVADKVGIGNTTPGSFYNSKLVVGAGSAEENITIYAGNTNNSGLFFADSTSGNARFSGQIYYNHGADKMAFATGYTGASSYVLELDGNKISGSATSTGSFGRVEASTLQGTIVTPSQTNITSVGTIGTGVWNGTAVASAYLDADTAHLSTTQTFSGAKTFSSTLNTAAITATGNISSSATSTGSFGRIEVLANTLAIGGTEIGKTVADNITALDQQLSTTSSPTFANLTTTGDITAQNYIVSSSVTYMTQSFSSGSTIFGNSADDTHVFVGNTISGSSTSTGSFGTVQIGGQHMYGDSTGIGIGTIQYPARAQMLHVQNGKVFFSHNSNFGQDADQDEVLFVNGKDDITAAFHTDSNVVGDHAGIGFGVWSGAYHEKGAIFFERLGSYGYGRLKFAVDSRAASNTVTPDYTVMQIDSGSVHITSSFGTAANLLVDGNISGSITSTGSFGRVEATTLGGTLTTAAQTNITSVGTIGTGTWEGTTVAVAQGGTGVTSKTGTGNVVLSASPTFTGTIVAAAGTFSGNVSGSAASTGSFGSLVVSNKVQGNLTIGGNLIIEGDTVQQQVANLNIEDRFILLNSGSAAGDGGLIVQTEANFSGVVLGYDDSESRWGFQQGTKLSASGSVLAPDAYASAVVTSDDSNYQKNGNIRVESGEIYIYVE